MTDEKLIRLIQANGRHNGYTIAENEARQALHDIRHAGQHATAWPRTYGALLALAARVIFARADAGAL